MLSIHKYNRIFEFLHLYKYNESILAAADELNGRPRKKLSYHTPEELFDEFLDSVYAAEGCGSIAQDGSLRLPY